RRRACSDPASATARNVRSGPARAAPAAQAAPHRMKPRDIAAVVHSRYTQDFGWGSRWRRLDAETRAEFDVRVFAGLVATGLDRGVAFNCRSTQEKGQCPGRPCVHDLRVDRACLLDEARV